MKIVYFGTAEFACPALRAMKEHIELVVSQPDRPSGRGKKLTASPVKKLAEELQLKIETPEKCRDSNFIESVREIRPDFLLVAAYGQIMPESLLESGRNGGINLHGSILPKYRGAAPIQRAIENGENETGVTLMQMAKGMDTGDIISVSRTNIGSEETYGELQERLGKMAALLAVEWGERISVGNYPRNIQNNAEATIAAKIQKEEGSLGFDMDLASLHRKYRAFTPSPGVSIQTSFGRLKIRKMALRSLEEKFPVSTVLSLRPFIIQFTGGTAELVVLQSEGQKPLAGSDWANGARIAVGDRFISN